MAESLIGLLKQEHVITVQMEALCYYWNSAPPSSNRGGERRRRRQEEEEQEPGCVRAQVCSLSPAAEQQLFVSVPLCLMWRMNVVVVHCVSLSLSSQGFHVFHSQPERNQNQNQIPVFVLHLCSGVSLTLVTLLSVCVCAN